MNKNPSQVAIAWLGFLISHTFQYLFMRYCMKEADAFINRYRPSCKKWRRCRWVMPLSSLRVSKGVMEMTYLG